MSALYFKICTKVRVEEFWNVAGVLYNTGGETNLQYNVDTTRNVLKLNITAQLSSNIPVQDSSSQQSSFREMHASCVKRKWWSGSKRSLGIIGSWHFMMNHISVSRFLNDDLFEVNLCGWVAIHNFLSTSSSIIEQIDGKSLPLPLGSPLQLEVSSPSPLRGVLDHGYGVCSMDRWSKCQLWPPTSIQCLQ